MEIRKALPSDIENVAGLYGRVSEYLEANINYPGWKKGIYPAREDAEKALAEGSLFIVPDCGKTAGSFILNHEPEKGYEHADWGTDFGYDEILVLRTLAVAPEFQGRGIGRAIIDFACKFAKENKIRALRLDVLVGNEPAIRLYKSCGFEYFGTFDLGYSEFGLPEFELYQKLI